MRRVGIRNRYVAEEKNRASNNRELQVVFTEMFETQRSAIHLSLMNRCWMLEFRCLANYFSGVMGPLNSLLWAYIHCRFTENLVISNQM